MVRDPYARWCDRESSRGPTYVNQVILPKQNESQVNDDLSEDLRGEVGVHFVSTIDEVLDLALSPPPPAQEKNG